MKVPLLLLAFMAVTVLGGGLPTQRFGSQPQVSPPQQWGWQNGQQSCTNCQCTLEYIPYCGTDEKTYSNKCFLQCAQRCNPNLRMKFEGVCAEKYVHTGGNPTVRPVFGWGQATSGSSTSQQYVRPQIQPVRPGSPDRPIYPVGTSRPYGSQTTYRPSYGSPTTFRPSFGSQTTNRPSFGSQTTNRPQGGYDSWPRDPTTTKRPSWASSEEDWSRPEAQRPYFPTTKRPFGSWQETTPKPWWVSQDQRGVRDADSEEYASEDIDDRK